MANGIYASDGTIRTTTVTGSSWTGLYAADGSYNIVLDDSSHNGLYHPCGAWRVSSGSNPFHLTYDPSGAYYLNTLLGTVSSSGTTPPFTPTTYLEDHFNNTGGANTNLSGWLPDTTGSVAWTQNAASTAGNGQVAFATDTIVWTSATASVYQNKTLAIPSANYKITATLSDNPATFSAPGIMMGVLDTAITGYLIYHDGQSALGISVQRGVAGAFSTFYSTTTSMPDGVAWGTTPHSVSVSRYVMSGKVRLKITDNTRGYTTIIDDTSGSRLTATAYPGIRGRQTAIIDDYKVESVPPQVQGGSELVADGSRSWYVMPDTICSGGDTYTGYVTSAGDIGVTRLRSGVISTSVLKSALEIDDHDNPSLIIIPSTGQMVALYTRHSTVDTFIRYRITTLPVASITTWDSTVWGAEQQISTGGLTCSYPKPVIFNGDTNIYVFYRSGSSTQRDQIVASTTIASLLAGTPTWTLTTVLQATGQRPYVQMRMNAAGDKLWFTSTNAHPAEAATSIYGGYFALSGGVLQGFDLAGTNTALPLQVASNLTLIQDTTGGTNWNMDIVVGTDGYPRMLISRYPTDPFTNTNVFLTDCQYWFYRWNGSAVSGFQLASGQHSMYPTQSPYLGNACFDGNYDGSTNTTIYSSEWDTTDLVNKLAAYTINEGTQARTKTRDISIDPSSHQWRPSSPIGHGADYALSWLEGGYALYTAYNTTMRYST